MKAHLIVWCSGCDTTLDVWVQANALPVTVEGFQKLHEAACFEREVNRGGQEQTSAHSAEAGSEPADVKEPGGVDTAPSGTKTLH